MRRSYQDCLKDAGELARRTNLQIIVIGAALLVSWLNGIEKQSDQLARKAEQFASVAAGSDRVRKEINDQRRRGADVAGRLNEARAYYDERCGPTSNDPSCNERLVRITSYQQNIAPRAEAQQRLTKVLDAQRGRRQEVEASLAQQVNFDLGFGLKFPLPFAYAPLIWLLILSFVVARTFVQRARFWSAVTRGLSQIAPVHRPGGRQLIDMPLWLRPVPSGARYRARGRDLATIVGWNGRSGRLLSAAILAVLALVAARVTWIGMVASEMVAQSPGAGAAVQPSVVAALLLSLTVVTGVCVILGLIWLALPWWTSGSSKLPAYARRERRLLLGAGVGAVVAVAVPTAIAATTGVRLKGLMNKASRARRFRRRQRWFVVEGGSLRPGWHRSNPSAIHFIWQGNRVRFTRGLKAGNLQRLAVQLDTRASEPFAPPPAWIRSPDFFFVIETLAKQLTPSRPHEAINVMLNWLANRSQVSGWRSVLPMLDKAGKLVRTADLRQSEPALARVLQELGELHQNDPAAVAALELRAAKWRSSNLPSR